MNMPRQPDKRARRYRSVVLRALERLSGGDEDPETLHRARTHLRRLQAYLELVGDAQRAAIMAGHISDLSRLRALQVLEHYLTKQGCKQSDLRAVRRAIAARHGAHLRLENYAAIARAVRDNALPSVPVSPETLADRMRILREKNRKVLLGLAGGGKREPRRKRLHRLRLAVKSARYQEEWALEEPCGLPELVGWLKKAQKTLGGHEDLSQHRRLAKKLKLKVKPVSAKQWKRSRERARRTSGWLHDRLADSEWMSDCR